MLLAIVIGRLLFPEFMMRKIYAKTLDFLQKLLLHSCGKRDSSLLGKGFFIPFPFPPNPIPYKCQEVSSLTPIYLYPLPSV
ncbi:hypothetical protein NSTCB13_02920 [Nostoc sp. DSM 114160]